ncbi:MAG: hypothetical protein EF806_01335 [Candidatus Methanoliparum thermophilum]|uniref:Uncharacterized protein n=1 Tax=Methanoliparum thermophilum TaxID=2491083 RepID=A0A520KU40_METT2|nr:hypothetical protein [Candidatus Methanoliparum sp. LAM-1]RZN65560.1 MAG: hypothetical protein EF806_01335 [Candidatus Methanoliparum thermophilum]BDC35342.1 hypothetical protein MTLP_00240 [Candidatus Methanoliparum sp. LAM-1]
MKINEIKSKNIWWYNRETENGKIASNINIYHTYKDRIADIEGFFCIKIIKLKPRLLFATIDDYGGLSFSIVDDSPIDEDMLINAIGESGGSFNTDCWYPINYEIEQILKDLL